MTLHPGDINLKDLAARRIGEYRQDFPRFAAEHLKVRDKEGKLVPFILNPIQRIMHEEAEKQKTATGRVRAIVLKYRRAGASSYILGRGYARSTLHQGVSTAIVSHNSQSTSGLFRIVKRFQDNNKLAPELSTSNVRGLEFAGLDSRYSVFSAENEEAGRGEEISFLHLSEAAYAPNLEALMSGLGRCVSDVPGTEIWLESTAKEAFGNFYERCMDSISGAGQYKLIFVPWHKDPTNSIKAPEDFEPMQERYHEAFPSEAEMMQLHGLTLDQIYWWRRNLGGARHIFTFAREFPSAYSDCWMAAESTSFISAVDVARCRAKNIQPVGAKIIGIDPASGGGDRFTIACRQGRKVLWVKHRTKIKFNEALEWIKAVIEDEKPDRVYIDAGGGGGGDSLCSTLRDDPAYERVIRPVNFGSTSQFKLARPDKPGPKDRKAEMAMRLKEAIESEEGLDLPDQEDIQSDICSVQKEIISPEGDWRLVPKKKLKTRSHDLFDAIGLTFSDKFVEPLPPASQSGKYAPVPLIAGVPPANASWMA